AFGQRDGWRLLMRGDPMRFVWICLVLLCVLVGCRGEPEVPASKRVLPIKDAKTKERKRRTRSASVDLSQLRKPRETRHWGLSPVRKSNAVRPHSGECGYTSI